jgi:hypothetical protein
MRWRWTDDARLMVRPFAIYRALAAAPEPQSPTKRWSRALLGPLQLMLTIGCFVSWTAAGRLVLDQIVFAAVFWGFLPLMQTVIVIVVARAAGSARTPATIVSLFFNGVMPWLLLMWLFGLLCMIPAGTFAAYRWLVTSGAIFVLVVIAAVWCCVLTYAFFREGLAMSRRRSGLSTLAFYAALYGSGVGWFLLTNQLQPLLGLIP